MSILSLTKKLVAIEKHYTALIIKNLIQIEQNKLYSDLRYQSLYKYLVKELNYSEGEAVTRVNAVFISIKVPNTPDKISDGSLSLTKASLANQTHNQNPEIDPQAILDSVIGKSTRSA